MGDPPPDSARSAQWGEAQAASRTHRVVQMMRNTQCHCRAHTAQHYCRTSVNCRPESNWHRRGPSPACRAKVILISRTLQACSITV